MTPKFTTMDKLLVGRKVRVGGQEHGFNGTTTEWRQDPAGAELPQVYVKFDDGSQGWYPAGEVLFVTDRQPLTPERRDEIVRGFLRYSFEDINFKYGMLTTGRGGEQSLCTEAEFEQLCAWVDGDAK